VGSIPIARSLRSGDSLIAEIAAVAQLVEYVLGKDGVKGSSPFSSFSAWIGGCFECVVASRGEVPLVLFVVNLPGFVWCPGTV
jgi:hypothetical protein